MERVSGLKERMSMRLVYSSRKLPTAIRWWCWGLGFEEKAMA